MITSVRLASRFLFYVYVCESIDQQDFQTKKQLSKIHSLFDCGDFGLVPVLLFSIALTSITNDLKEKGSTTTQTVPQITVRLVVTIFKGMTKTIYHLVLEVN